jgi:large subunit ribosomal protein L4
VKGLARRSAFNARAEKSGVLLIDGLVLDAPKTARLREYLGAIEAGGKVLLLTEGQKINVYLSARNLPDVEVRPFGEESVYDILWATTVIIERAALEKGGPDVASPEEEGADA